METINIHRQTKETDIRLQLNLAVREPLSFQTGLPFFDHMLNAMAFHGGFSLQVEAKGDLEVDPHHLVEDTGLVLGQALKAWLDQAGAVARYGQSIIPMDEALSEVVLDVCNRPYWVYNVKLPQNYAGTFDLTLIREFFIALTNKAQINLHAHCRYGENAHHMIEALFKALGRAIAMGYAPKTGGLAAMSTKGTI